MLLSQIPARLRAYQNYRKMVRELSALPDQALRDIGVARGDIRSAALDLTQL